MEGRQAPEQAVVKRTRVMVCCPARPMAMIVTAMILRPTGSPRHECHIDDEIR